MPIKAPAIFPNQPNRPKMSSDDATSPSILNPDTLPLPILPKKFPSISNPLPPNIFLRKLPIPPHAPDTPDTDEEMLSMFSPTFSIILSTLSEALPATSKPLSTVSSPTRTSAAVQTIGLSFTMFSHAR